MAKYTIPQLKLLYFFSNNMDEDEFEEYYGNVSFTRLEKLMAEKAPEFSDKETSLVDFVIEPDDDPEKKYEIENIYEGKSLEELAQYFVDEDVFYSLQNCELELIAQEIAKLVKRNYGLNEEMDICVYNMTPKIYASQVFGSTTDSDGFSIYKITKNQIRRPDNFVARKTVGLSYLDTIIHETVHACQFEILKDFLRGNESEDKKRNYMNVEYILRSVIEETDNSVFKQENDTYFNQTWEFEARQVARDMIIDLYNSGALQGENVKDFILFNYGCEVENMNFKKDYQREQIKEAVLFNKLKKYFNETFEAEKICPILLETINKSEFVDYIGYVGETFNKVRREAGDFWKDYIKTLETSKADSTKIANFKKQLAENEFSNLHKMYVMEKNFDKVMSRGINLYSRSEKQLIPKSIKVDLSKFTKEVEKER